MKLQELLDELREMERDLKFELLIEYAERFTDVSPEVAKRPFSRENKAPSCESDAYCWVTRSSAGVAELHFAVENPQGISAKALAVILQESLNGASREEILSVSEEIIYDIFGRSISMGKGQGLMGMVRIVKEQAAKNI